MKTSTIRLAYKEEYELLKRRIEGHSKGYRQNIAVLGRPFIGKTFLISQVIKDLPENMASVLIDAKSVDPVYLMRSFTTSLLSSYLRFDSRQFDDIEGLLQASKDSLPRTCPLIRELLSNVASLETIFDLLQTFLKDTGARLLFVIENFEYLPSVFGEGVFESLSDYIMNLKDVMFLLSSSSVSRARKILRGDLSLLFGNFEEIFLDSVSPSACKRYLSELVPEMPVRLHKFLFSFTGGSPFYMDIICRDIKNRNLTSQDKLWDEIITIIYDQVFSEYGLIYQHFLRLVSSITDGPRGPQVSTFLLASTRESSLEKLADTYRWQRQVIDHKADVLSDLGLVYKDHNHLFFEDSLFKFWLKYVYTQRVEYPNLSIDHYRDRAFSIIKKEIASFIQEDSMGEMNKILQLFRAFEDCFIVMPNGRKRRFYRFSDISLMDKGLEIYKAVTPENIVWLFSYRPQWSETDIFDFVDALKRSTCHRKIIISKESILAPVKVIAKETNIWIWGYRTLNHLLRIHNIGEIVW